MGGGRDGSRDRGREGWREEADDCNCFPDPTSFICPRVSWIWSPCLREESDLPAAVADLQSSGFTLIQP